MPRYRQFGLAEIPETMSLQYNTSPFTHCSCDIYGKRSVTHAQQIGQTKAESQQIVATRLLYCLQYLVSSKSYAMDLRAFDIWQLGNRMILKLRGVLWVSGHQRLKASLSSTDSDLEAFSHNPTDGSFAALVCQLTAKTNYPNQRFLSYWVELLLRDRYIYKYHVIHQ